MGRVEYMPCLNRIKQLYSGGLQADTLDLVCGYPECGFVTRWDHVKNYNITYV